MKGYLNVRTFDQLLSPLNYEYPSMFNNKVTFIYFILFNCIFNINHKPMN